MSMTPARPGSNNGGVDEKALFLTTFSGEVLTAFDEHNKFQDKSLVRNITSGKSAQFPATWKAVARYHTPGTLITGQTILSGERIVFIDDLLISDVSIASIDEAMAHYDFRGPYTKQIGAALARTYDKNVAQVGIKTARSAATITGANGGTVINAGLAAKTDMTLLVAGIAAAAQALDEKDVPEEDRFVFLTPAVYYRLLRSAAGKELISEDGGNSGNGSQASGKIRWIFGMQIVKTNNLPQTNVATGPVAYQGDFTNTAALVMHMDAVGTVRLLDVATEMDYLLQYKTTLMVSSMAVGHGILRPECSVEVAAAA